MFTFSFDESLNKIAQKGQMDVIVRYWKDNQVHTRYLTSMFLGHAAATDLLKAINDVFLCYGLNKKKNGASFNGWAQC